MHLNCHATESPKRFPLTIMTRCKHSGGHILRGRVILGYKFNAIILLDLKLVRYNICFFF